jgi:hypothetical protein
LRRVPHNIGQREVDHLRPFSRSLCKDIGRLLYLPSERGVNAVQSFHWIVRCEPLEHVGWTPKSLQLTRRVRPPHHEPSWAKCSNRPPRAPESLRNRIKIERLPTIPVPSKRAGPRRNLNHGDQIGAKRITYKLIVASIIWAIAREFKSDKVNGIQAVGVYRSNQGLGRFKP